MNVFDAAILHWLNQFAHRSEVFDLTLGYVSGSEMMKGNLFMLMFWWLWFFPRESRARNREIIVSTMCAAFAAVVLGRALAFFLPFRLRPLFNPDLSFILPFGVDRSSVAFRTWSAFPSDHAMLFAAMSTGLYFISAPLGLAAFAYSLLVVGLPRVYLGLHHPTDVLAGALLGVAVAWAANSERPRAWLSSLSMRWHDQHEGSFYAAAYFGSRLVATMFNGPREFLLMLVKHLHGHP
jgi:membrane-associated phospholipid phosphatase